MKVPFQVISSGCNAFLYRSNNFWKAPLKSSCQWLSSQPLSSPQLSAWTPLKPQHSNPNPNPLANQLGLLTSVLLPHLSSSLTDSMPSLNLLCHSKTHAQFMQDAPKAVWSILYVSVTFSVTYRSSKTSDCIFEIHHLWQSGFCRVYSNCCCRCSFKPEIIKVGQSSHKLYSNKILNFQESTTILNACTKKEIAWAD